MTTVADLIEDTFDHLYAGQRRALNLLAGAIDAVETTLICSDDVSPSIASGSFIAVDDELMYVRSTVPSTNTVTVLRGQRGTTGAAHASGALVDINPRFARYRVKQLLREEIRSWPETVYQVSDLDLETESGKAGYDLAGIPGEFYGIVDVQVGPESGTFADRSIRPRFNLYRNASFDVFPSGNGIVFDHTSTFPAVLRVLVAVPFDVDGVWDDDTDLETDCGVPLGLHDVPPLGAAWRLMSSRDVKRSMGEGQPDPRHAEEVPPGFASSTATFLQRLRDRRLADESLRLKGRYPVRVS